MSGLALLSWLLAVCCYVSCSSKSLGEEHGSSAHQAIKPVNLANHIGPTVPAHAQQQQEQHSQQPQQKQPQTLVARQKRSQQHLNGFGNDNIDSDEYFQNITPFAYNLALLNIMQRLQKQLTNIDSYRLRQRLGRSAVAFQLLNDVFSGVDIDSAAAAASVNSASSNNVDGVNGSDSDSGSGNGGGNGSGSGRGSSASFVGNNDMVADDIGDIAGASGGRGAGSGMPWQFRRRVSKKSSALYKPRLGKRTQACN